MPTKYRPILKLPTTYIEKVYDGISLALSISIGVIALWSFLNLPEIIPIHWNIKGEADGFGSRNWIVFIPIIYLLFVYVNSWVTKIPHQYNYLKVITEDNVKEQYIYGRKVIRVAMLCSQIAFALIMFYTIKGSVTEDKNIGIGLMLVLLIMCVVPIAYVVYVNKK